MLKKMAVAAVITTTAYASLAQAKDVESELKIRCNYQESYDKQSDGYQSAIKIYSLMKEHERQACSKREDDYISFLTKKYGPFVDSHFAIKEE